MIKLLQNRNFILILALILGIFVSFPAIYLKEYAIYILAFMMLMSLNLISLKEINNFNQIIKPVLLSILLNYFLFGILILILARLFYLPEDDIFKGFVFIVVAPPGAVIVPFTYLYGGNSRFSLWGVIGASLFLLILFPLVVLLIMGNSLNNGILELFKILTVTIILPLILSQFLLRNSFFMKISKYKGKIIDWSFFLIVYIVIGLNSNMFINHIEVLLKPAIILMVLLFGFSFLFILIMKKINIVYSDRISYLLMIFVKNNPFSAVISLQLAGKVAAIPSVALSVVLLIYLIFFPLIAFRMKD